MCFGACVCIWHMMIYDLLLKCCCQADSKWKDELQIAWKRWIWREISVYYAARFIFFLYAWSQSSKSKSKNDQNLTKNCKIYLIFLRLQQFFCKLARMRRDVRTKHWEFNFFGHCSDAWKLRAHSFWLRFLQCRNGVTSDRQRFVGQRQKKCAEKKAMKMRT